MNINPIHRTSPARRRRPRALTGGAIGIVVGSLVLSACGIGGGSGEVGANGKPTMAGKCELSDEVTSNERLTGEPSGTITLQTTALKQDFGDYFEKLIAAFEKKYPDVTVKWQDDPGDAEFTQRLVTNAQSCDLPDVVNLNQTTAYALHRENFLLDLSTKGPEDIGEPFIQSVWDSQTFPGDDDHYVLPWYWGLTGLQTFNTDLMKDAGLDPAAPPKTVMEQFDMASTIAAKSDGEYYAFPANPYTRVPSDWQLMNANITNEDQTKFTFAEDPKIKAWLTKYAELYTEGALPRDTLSSDVDVTQKYSAGDIVWGSTNASFLRYVKDTNEATYDVTGVATLFDARGHAFQDGQLIGVPSTSKNPVAAVAFAQFMLSPEWQTEFVSSPQVSNFPSTQESLEIPKFTDISGDSPLDVANQLSVDNATNAENVFIFAWSDAVQTKVVSELQLAISGKKPVDDALQDAEDEANQILDQQG